jgi:hypothetical protein
VKTGALIFRRANGYWSIDEFAADGRYMGSDGGNHSSPRIVGWRENIEWPDYPTPLGALSHKPFLRRDTVEPRKGLVRYLA